MENFADYIEILKVLRNVCTQNREFLKLVWNSLLRFVEKPSLFNNSTELFKVDELHTELFKIGSSHVQFEKVERTVQEAM